MSEKSPTHRTAGWGDATLATSMPMRRTWGAAESVEGKGDPAGTAGIAGSRQIW